MAYTRTVRRSNHATQNLFAASIFAPERLSDWGRRRGRLIANPTSTQPAGAQHRAAPAQAPTTVRYANFDWWAFTPGVKWDVYHQQEAFPRFREAHPNVDLRWEPFGAMTVGGTARS